MDAGSRGGGEATQGDAGAARGSTGLDGYSVASTGGECEASLS